MVGVVVVAVVVVFTAAALAIQGGMGFCSAAVLGGEDERGEIGEEVAAPSNLATVSAIAGGPQ